MTKELSTEKTFILKNTSNNQISSKTTLTLIKRADTNFWVMNHLFLNPAEHDKHELSLLLQEVISYVRSTDIKVWPLDPIAIQYFKKHPQLNDIWHHQPFSK